MAESIPNRKQELRKELQKQRDLLLSEEAAERSLKISTRILEMDLFQSAEVIHTYVPIVQKKEVDTTLIIYKVFELGKSLVVPKMVARHQLEHYRIDTLDDLKPNKWGIPEPVRGEAVSPADLDVIFVPMLAGDTLKNRLGFGRGFYDRLLIKTNAVKIGLLYHFQLFETPIPVERFDVPLDVLVTDQTVVR